MGTPIILSDLSCRYDDELALRSLNATIPPGRVTALVGHNGSGKSTALLAIAGLLRPVAGTITGTPADIAFVPQRSSVPDHLPITVRETVAMGRWRARGPLRRLGAEDRAVVGDCLERLGLGDLADRRLSALSGGQRQRTLVAQGLAQRCALLLLDEPLSGIDVTAAHDIDAAIAAERDRGTTVVLATHERAQIESADEVVLLRRGVRMSVDGEHTPG